MEEDRAAGEAVVVALEVEALKGSVKKRSVGGEEGRVERRRR